MSIKRVLLVRHGQTDWNVEGRWQGSEPVPLNEDGRAQAKALADYLQDYPISDIYSSDLPRAMETATAVGQAVGLVPHAEPRWREFNLGIFQGYTREEIQTRFQQEWKAFHDDYWDYTVPNGESRRDLQNRAYAAWQDLLKQANGPEAMVVTHGGTIRHLLLKLFDDAPAIQSMRIENTSVTVVERDGDSWRLAQAAAVPHL